MSWQGMWGSSATTGSWSALAKPHYTNQGIKETRALTVNIVDEAMLKKADRTGCVSGNKVDKSDMFAYHTEGTGAPVVNEAPVVMGLYRR